jgi:hypothetical protein
MSNLSTGTRIIAVTPSDTNYITGLTWVAENGVQTTPTSVTIASDLFTLAGNGLANGDIIVPTNLGTVTGTGLAINRQLFIVGVAGDNFQVSLTYGGSAIDLGGADTTPITYVKAYDIQTVRQDGFLSVVTSGVYRVLPSAHFDTNSTTVADMGAQDIYIAAGAPCPVLVKKVFVTGSVATTGIDLITN